MSDPLVRKALELFDGSLVNVERVGPGQAAPAEEPEAAPGDKE